MIVPLRVDYGPYEAFGVIAHRIQKARGLLKRLRELGYDVEVREVGLLNKLEIIMCCRKIFQCDIRNLRFNMDYDDDPVCAKAIAIVEEASNRMATEINLSNFASARKEMKRSEMIYNDSINQPFDVYEEMDEQNEENEVCVEEEEEEDDEDVEEMSIKFRDAIKRETNRELERIETQRMEKTLKEGMEEAKRQMFY